MADCSDYQIQRAWSDKFIPEIKRLVGPHLLIPSSFEDDTQHACDLIILKARDMRIAARVRKHSYIEKYANEFTIRSKTRYNQWTELHKIILDGWGDWMFYGFADESETCICRWFLIDLHVLRRDKNQCKNKIITGEKSNFDGTGFRWFNIKSFSPDILIACSHPEN